MDVELEKLLRMQHYHLVGRHSAVKACHWLKESIVRGRACYKERFYGIASHRCVQMTPAVAWCQHRCVFCWRPVERTVGTRLEGEVDEPSYIAERSLEEQRRIISGYWGHQHADMEKLREAARPRHVAISLAGEPTTYPYIAELIEEYRARGMSTFLVSNGQNPERLAEARPSQLYLSLIGYDRELYRRLSVPQVKDGWERFNESLDVFRDARSRKVIRITLVKGYNLEAPERFAPFIERAEPDFIEPKGYVHVGYSRRRLERAHMPSMEEVMRFAEKLSLETGYALMDRSPDSKVALLVKG